MKITQKQKIAQYSELNIRKSLLTQALQSSLLDNINWFHVTDPDENGAYYRYGVSDLNRASGGLFWSCFVCEHTGQSESFDVEYLDEMMSRLHAEQAMVSQFYIDMHTPIMRALEMRRKAAGVKVAHK